MTFISPIRTGLFWTGLSRADHVCQLYPTEATFLNALESFVASGLRHGESVIVIASAPHLHALEQRLRIGSWIDIDRARWEDRYIAILALETLDKILVNDWPDPSRFDSAIMQLVERARGKQQRREVRMFSEMMALLWARGKAGAMHRLEHLSHELVKRESVPLYCAYPRSSFGEDAQATLRQVCTAHDKVLPDPMASVVSKAVELPPREPGHRDQPVS
jgi:hypothetical protein